MRSTVLLNPSDIAASRWAAVYPKLVRRKSCVMRADSDFRGEIQSVVVALRGVAICCIEPPSRRTTPTPTPVATAAASACLRVMPRVRAGGATACSPMGATLTGSLKTDPPPLALDGCEEFVSAGGTRLVQVRLPTRESSPPTTVPDTCASIVKSPACG